MHTRRSLAPFHGLSHTQAPLAHTPLSEPAQSDQALVYQDMEGALSILADCAAGAGGLSRTVKFGLTATHGQHKCKEGDNCQQRRHLVPLVLGAVAAQPPSSL